MIILSRPFLSRCKRHFVKLSAAGLAMVLFLLWAALHSRAQSSMRPDVPGMPTAGVARVTRQDLFKEITIPAEFRPYVEAKLVAKVSGYVRQMNVDFGDKVKAGQLLATLEVPELQDELHSAIASLQKAEADYTNANLLYSRLSSVNKEHPNLVAQQDLDTANASNLSTAAGIAEARAEVEKYQTLMAYTKITAPFDGVVTRRYADPGALVQAGTASDTQAMALVRVSDNYLLRLDFPVSVDYVKDIKVGDVIDVRVESLNGKTFPGKIARFTDNVDDNTRTMITEIEVPNPGLELIPGMYATVVLKVEQHPNALSIPIQAVSNAKASTVLVLNRDHQVEDRQVQLGIQTADRYEVLSGLSEGDLVVIGSPSEFQNGEKVEPKILQLSMRDDF
jgi:RND family efflux transporter MFP subunit